jgi:hypothetical protein
MEARLHGIVSITKPGACPIWQELRYLLCVQRQSVRLVQVSLNGEWFDLSIPLSLL